MVQPCFAALTLVISLLASASTLASDGGVYLHRTRIIFPQKNNSQLIQVSNSSGQDKYLLQAWIENAAGYKSQDFILTPSLYKLAPKNGKLMRIAYAGEKTSRDKEKLYYFVVKATPFANNEPASRSSLHIATATRIKIFLRPQGLKPDVDAAPDMIRFRQAGNQAIITNPSPYYITLKDIYSGHKQLQNVMIPPKGMITEDLPAGAGDSVEWRNIDDYGVASKVHNSVFD